MDWDERVIEPTRPFNLLSAGTPLCLSPDDLSLPFPWGWMESHATPPRRRRLFFSSVLDRYSRAQGLEAAPEEAKETVSLE